MDDDRQRPVQYGITPGGEFGGAGGGNEALFPKGF
jgi:hypothetical protein